LGILSCTNKSFTDVAPENKFFLEFQDEIIRISGDNLSLSSVFKAPDLSSGSNEKGNWEFKETIESFITFAGEKGTLRTDIFISNDRKLERKTWISDQNDLVTFQHVFFNSSNKEVKLNALFPFFLSDEQSLFSENSKYRVLTQKTLKNGLPGVVFPNAKKNINNNLIVSNDPLESDNIIAGKIINSDPFLIINDSLGNNNLFIGSQSYYLHLFELNLEFIDKGNGQQIKTLESKCNFEGVIVPPNVSRESQWIVMSQGRDPYKLITDFTERTNKLHGFSKPEDKAPSVYCAFYYYGLGYNEKYFKNDIATFKNDILPFDVFQIDACWQQHYGHDFETNQRVFPSGMKWAADQIHSLGYIPGIWTAPYIVKIDWSNPATDLKKNHPEWLVKNSKGEFVTWINQYYILDATYPGVTDYLEESYRKLAQDWGYEYFKFDFMRTIFLDADQQFYDKTATSLEAYRKGLEAIRRGVGEESYISVCGGHYGASYGIADSHRSGSDTRSIWDEREVPKYRQNILRTWMSDYWHVDPDAMGIRRQEVALPGTNNKSLGLLTDDQVKTNTLNQFMGGGMVCFAEDFAVIDEDRKALYRHVIPSINSPSKPIDMFDPLSPNLILTQVSPVCKDLPEWTMVSVVNWSDNPKSYEIKLDEKIINPVKGNKFVVSEFFSQKVIGVFEKNQSITIENQRPHQSQLLRIIPWDGRKPVLAGTDLHFSGGGVEIKEWKARNGKITGTIDTPWNYPVQVTILLPETSEKGFKTETIRLVPGQKKFTWSSN
jgi:hypothetical protein